MLVATTIPSHRPTPTDLLATALPSLLLRAHERQTKESKGRSDSCSRAGRSWPAVASPLATCHTRERASSSNYKHETDTDVDISPDEGEARCEPHFYFSSIPTLNPDRPCRELSARDGIRHFSERGAIILKELAREDLRS